MPCRVTTPANPDGSSLVRRCASKLSKMDTKRLKSSCSTQEHENILIESERIRTTKSRITSRTEVTFPCRTTTWCTNRFPYRRQWQIVEAKAALDKEWENMQKLPAWDESKVTSEGGVTRRAKFAGNNFHIATLWTCVISRTANWRKSRKVRRKSGIGRFCLWKTILELRCIDGAMCFSVTHDGGKSPKRYFNITRLFWTSK